MSASTAMVLEGLRELARDPEALAEARPALRLILGLDDVADAVPLEPTAAAAARLGLAAATVERMARAGRLPGAVKVGNSWRIPVGAIPSRGPDAEAPAATVPPRRPAVRGRRSSPEPAGRTSAESAMDDVITGRVRRTTPRSTPASAGTDRGRGTPSVRDSMYEKNGTRPGGATVTPIARGTR